MTDIPDSSEDLMEEIMALKIENHDLQTKLVQLNHQEFLLFEMLEDERKKNLLNYGEL